ncbi:MAG: AAA family ATPase [Chlamydiae bacterium]|nr:AAA family ATPase [Chlamydiota bacterium]
MITRLFIQNLILLEKAEIHFGEGLHIITGETGAGKSALLTAIRLLLGAKSDEQLIRQDALSAIVEAELTISGSLDWLQEEGIDPPTTSTICVRREIHRSGKNRCFFEESQVSLSILKKIVSQMIELVDQGSSATLCMPGTQRKWLDAFGRFSEKIFAFSQNFKKERTLKESLQGWIEEKQKADSEQKIAEEDLRMIENAALQENEEEKLTEEHNLLTNSQELLQTAASSVNLLSESQEPLIFILKKAAHSIDQLVRFDQRLIEPASMLKRSALELEDAVFFLRSYINELDANPQRLSIIEERLALIEKLKKRFGHFSKLSLLKETLIEKLEHLSQLDAKISAARGELEEIRENNRRDALEISTLRKIAALELARAVTQELQSLNLPHARFDIQVETKVLEAHGADEICFLFSANPGYPPLPLQDCASGGELSRVFLAIKTHLAEKDQNTCLIFDEIDSNVGGQTAAILGEKLQALSLKRQVICVTHFVQVASCGAHHFLVSKKDALTTIKRLSDVEREEEFNRMLGKKSLV